MPRLLDLPTELGLRIARNLDLADAINLACSGSATVDIGESKSWSSIEIPYHVGRDRSASNLIATLDAARTGLMAAVDCRPSRRNHIRKLTIYLIPGAVPLVKALLAPPSAITVLDIEASRIDPSSVASPIAVIGSGLPLPLLTHLTLDQEFTTESELYTCLLNTPNLVSLNLRLLPHAGPDRNEHWDLPAGVPGDEDVEPKDASAAAEERKADALDSKKREMQQARESAALLVLPKLSKLNIVAKEWPSIVAAIVDHAPLLETLRIRYGILDRAGEPGRMPPAMTPRRQLKIEDVFRCKSVRSFDADDGPAQYIAGQMATDILRDWMPALTKLSMWSSPCPGRMPKHDSLEELVFWHQEDQYAVPMIDSIPSPRTTGLLASWVAHALRDDLPSLTRLAFRLEWDDFSLNMEESRIEEKRGPGWAPGYNLMVFNSPTGEALYHARASRGWGGIDAASFTRREHDPSSPSLDGLAETARKVTVHYGTAAAFPYSPVSGIDRDDGFSAPRALEFTYYRGLPLSMEVLQWVYAQAKLDWEWRKGRRNVRFPDHVWAQLLRCWEEKEHLGVVF